MPRLDAVHHSLLFRRWASVRRLVEDAQRVRASEVVVIVGDEGDRVSIGVVFGVDALVLVAEAGHWAVAFLMATPWVPIVVTSTRGSDVVFARTTTEN